MSGMDDRNVHACKWYKKVFPDNDELGCKGNEEILFITSQDEKIKKLTMEWERALQLGHD